MPESVPFGPFDVLGRLGFGGMGEVFRARVRDDPSQPDIALKLLRPEYAVHERYRQMFIAEAKVGAFLKHDNVVRMFDVGEIEGMLYLATELVDGVSLDRLVDSGPLPPPLAVFVARELLAGLHYAHELTAGTGRSLHIVHRDVSASNALISHAGAVKLSDFGLAKIAGLSLTLTNEVKGKRAYMAPEQLEAGAMDRRVDVFAMGVLLHELVMGRRPFADTADWMRGRPEIHGTPFDRILTKALSISPASRFSTAAELSAALVAACAPARDANAQLSQRVGAAREALKPLNKFDRIFLDELAGSDESSISAVLRRRAGSDSGQRWPDEASDARTAEHVGVPRARLRSAEPEREQEPPPAHDPVTAAVAAPPPKRGPALVALTLGAGVIALGAIWVVRQTRAELASTPAAVAAPPPVAVPAPEPPAAPPTVVATAPAIVTPLATDGSPVHGDPPAKSPSHARPSRRPPPAARAEIAAGPPGYLLLDTDPWATVFLGGAKLGTTPLRVPLPPGRHELMLAPKDQAERHPLSVVITSGQEQRKSVKLR